jgi:hypothetical protein
MTANPSRIGPPTAVEEVERIALIDGDIVAYKAAAMWQGNQDWAFGYKRHVSPEDAAAEARRIAADWQARAGCSSAIVCLSPRDRTTFRHHLVANYKADRPGHERPDLLAAAIAALEASFDHQRLPLLEADDVMGILGTSTSRPNTVVVTIDKDLRGVPCRLLNPDKDEPPAQITEVQANYFWMTQTLTGDPVDGYKGCPRVGPAKAAAILGSSPTDLWAAVYEAFARAGLSFADALLQARLARILRREDYDAERNAIWLWHPQQWERFDLTTAPPVRPAKSDRAVHDELWRPHKAAAAPVDLNAMPPIFTGGPK